MSQAYIKFMTNLNSILKDKSIEEITNILPNIKTMIIRELDMIATEYNLSDDDRKLFIEQKIKEFKIKGLPLGMYEKSWEEKNHFLQDYKEMYDVSNRLGIFPKKTIKINVNGKIMDIEVLDTGKKYIPSSDFNVSIEIIQVLDELKTKEKETKDEIKQEFSNTKTGIINDFNTSIDILTNNETINKSL